MGSGERSPLSPERETARDYRRLLATLTARARRFGSSDPESAAQETLKRSLENTTSQQAAEYYLSQDPPAGLPAPAWALDELLAWLHVVLRNVVREEHSRAGYRREVPMEGEIADLAPAAIESLIRQEVEQIVRDCFPKLDREYRRVLSMRAEGLKYGEIARRLDVNENTVATWVSRGIRELARCVRKRTEAGR
jgi:DNA-directed RNA polymerase specialized sigma24 family protein